VKLQEIERLRAIAVLMVMYTHTGPSFGALDAIFNNPRTGVDLFFVISGFVVTRSLLRLLPDLTAVGGLDVAFDQSRRALRHFYARRFFRIVPLAVSVVILQRLCFVIGMPPELLGGDLDGYWREVIAVFTGVYNYAMPNEGYSFSQLGVYWSLSVEEHSYLLLPLSFLLVRTRAKRIGVALFGIAFVALICRTLFDTPPPGTVLPDFYRILASHLRFDALFAGVALAMLFDAPPVQAIMPPRFVKWVIVPACVAMLAAIPKVLPANTYFHQGFTAAWFLSAILVAYASFDKGYIFDIPLIRRGLEHVGARSYALYLLHVPLFRFDKWWNQSHPAFAHYALYKPWRHWALFLLAAVVLSEVSWRLLEWPLQKLGRRLTATPATT